MATIEVNGKRVEVDDAFLSLSPAEQEATVDEIAASLGPQEKHPLMGQLNRGIANTIGGAVDLVNPFDKPHALNPFDEGTGSAVTGLESTMRAAGIEVSDRDPETFMEGAFRGAGNAAAALPMVAGGAQALSRVPGFVGSIADDAARVMATKGATAAEIAAGGLSGGAEQAAENAGLPEWAQNTAAIAAPMAAVGAGVLVKGAAGYLPGVALARQGVKAAKGALAPYTKAGATEVARGRLQNLAGGPERAEELAGKITNDNPLGLTPAQQTEDPNMIALERLAAEQDPNLRAALEARRAQGQEAAQREIIGDGSPEDAKQFFEARRQDFKARFEAIRDQRLDEAGDRLSGIDATRAPSENSVTASRQLDAAYDAAKAEETALWDAVPLDVVASPQKAREVAQKWATELGRAGFDDMPRLARQLLLESEGYADQETARELHRLYSKMRETARNDMAGNATRPARAKVANEIADAILEDLSASSASQQLAEARAATKALHDVFDKGAPGRLTKKTLQGEEAIAPELSLDRTVGRGGTAGMVDARDLEGAGVSGNVIQDYVAGQFAGAALNAGDGVITTRGARVFLSKNKELLDRYPELKDELSQAVKQRETAEAFATRIEKRLAMVEDERRSATARFIGGRAEDAVKAVFTSSNPAKTARRLANEARKDRSGAALAGVKSAFSEQLIGQALQVNKGQSVLKSDRLISAITKPENEAALRAIFDKGELSRMKRLASELAKAERGSSANIGESLSGARASQLIEIPLRIIAARRGADLGGGGGASIQTAQMASSRMRDAVNSLASDKAAQMLADAVTDPQLFRALLTDVGSIEGQKRAMPYLLPYLVGGVAGQASE